MESVPERPDERIALALNALAARLHARGIDGELYVTDDRVVAIAFDARRWPARGVEAPLDPQRELRAAAQQVGAELKLAPDWVERSLRDVLVAGAEPGAAFARPGLRVVLASPRLLLAAKLLAARAHEADELRLLADQLDLHSADEVLAVVAQVCGERLDAAARAYAQRLFAG